MPNWFFFRPGNNGAMVQFTPSPSLSTPTIPIFMDETNSFPIPNFYSVNAIHDDYGEPLFYIVLTDLNNGTSGYFYDKYGNVILEKTTGNPYLFSPVPAREIPIINLDCGRHHAIVGNFVIEIDITGNTWSKIFPTSNPLGILNVFGMLGSPNNETIALEIGSLNSTSYKIYNLIGNYPGGGSRSIRIVEIDYQNNTVVGSSDYNITTITLPGSSTPIATQFTGSISELEVSPDNNYLAFAEEENLLIFNLDGSGNINTTSPIYKYYFYQNAPSNKDYSIAGIEFTRNCSSLVFSRFDPKITPTFTEEIAVWDFVSSSTPNYISGTSNYVRSQIELGTDDKIYTSSATHLAEITTSGTLSVTNILASSFDFNNDPGNGQVRILPDQVSGHTYQVTPFEVNSYDVTTSGSWTPGTGNNPFNVASEINVITKITVKTGVTLTIEDLTLNLFTNAEVIVEAGATLFIKNSTLKSHSCGLMWKGINVLDNGTTGGNLMITNNSSLQTSLIMDAITGVKINGPNSWLVVHGYSDFTGNETDINITNGNSSNIQIYRANFTGDLVLKDQTKGSNIGWPIDNLNRTITHIHLENCTGKTIIGSSGFSGCDFKYAHYGIKAINSSLESVNNLFTEQKIYGIHGDANKLAQKEINIYSNTLTDVQQPIRLENWINSEIQSNQIYGSKEWGIHYLENENCKLLIGDYYDPSKGNTLDFCNWAGIDLSENSGIETKINIGHNIINNHPYATGIVVSEYGSGSSPTYELFRIHNNSMDQIGAGIKLYNIEGWNTFYSGVGPTPHNNLFNPANIVDSNTINFTTILYPHDQIGIQTSNSNKLNIHYNTVNSQAGNDWRNTGIMTDDAYWTSIYRNVCSGGSGIRIGGNMLISNVYCNSLPNSFTGIFLNYCYLRGAGDYHGIISNQARENAFPSTLGGFDMRMYYSNNDLNQWVFYSAVPTIDYTFASGTLPDIEGGYGNNVCWAEGLGEGEGNNQEMKSGQGFGSGSKSSQNIIIPSQINLKKALPDYGKINTLKASINHAKDSLHLNLTRNDIAWNIAKINKYIQTKKMDSAIAIVNSLSSTDSIVNELLVVYKILGKLQFNKQKLSLIESEQIIQIARKNQFTSSIASPLARIIVKQTLQLDIYDSLEFIPQIYGLISNNCSLTFSGGLIVKLLNPNNTETGIFAITDSLGQFSMSSNQFFQLSPTTNYKLVCLLPDSSKAQSISNTIGGFIQTKEVALFCQTSLAKKQNQKLVSGKANQHPKIYPNPTNGKFIIEGEENTEIYVYDLLGKMILNQTASGKTLIDLGDQPKGVYLIKLIGIENFSFKLLIE